MSRRQRSGLCREVLLQAMALLALGCAAAQCQSMKSTLEQAPQSTFQNSDRESPNFGGQSGTLLRPVSIMPEDPRQTAAAARKPNRLVTSSSATPSGEAFCFEPGVGWVIQHQDIGTGTHAFRSAPLSVDVTALGARRMPQSSDLDACDANLGGSSASQTARAPAFDPESPQQSPGQNGGKQIDVQQAPGAPGEQGLETESGNIGDVTYSFGPDQASQLASIRMSLTRNGNIVMSVVSPGAPIGRTMEPAQLLQEHGQPSTSLDDAMKAFGDRTGSVSSASFIPGQSQNAEGISGEASGENHPFSQHEIREDQRHVIGRETPLLKQQEKRAASGEAISPGDIHAYRQIYKACSRMLDQVSRAGGDLSSDLPSPPGGTSHAAMHGLQKGCRQFLLMDRSAALRYLARHHGLD